MGWLPIESAPRDRTAVLVMSDDWPGTKSGRAEECNGHNTYVAEWWANEDGGDGEWVCYMSAVQDPRCPIDPTHWMPLPPPPSAEPVSSPALAQPPAPQEGLFEKGARAMRELAAGMLQDESDRLQFSGAPYTYFLELRMWSQRIRALPLPAEPSAPQAVDAPPIEKQLSGKGPEQSEVAFDDALTPEQIQRESDEDSAAILAEQMGECRLATARAPSSTWTLPNGTQAVSRGDWNCEKCGHQHIAGLGGICVGCPCPEDRAPPAPVSAPQDPKEKP